MRGTRAKKVRHFHSMDTNSNSADAGAAPSTTETPTYRLYDAASALFAWLLGSPVAGVTLMSLNYRRLGDREKAVTVVIIGFLCP
jgi:hypothetical protein